MCWQITILGRSQYKPIQHQIFAIEKFRDLIVTTQSCPGDKKSLLKKVCSALSYQKGQYVFFYRDKQNQELNFLNLNEKRTRLGKNQQKRFVLNNINNPSTSS